MKKLELKDLKVASFVTKEHVRVKGGAEPTAPPSCGECGPTVTCPTFGYGDCTNFYEPCIG
jgi:hypothetical protein